MPDLSQLKKWTITLVGSAIGGGIAGAFAAAMDPTKYQFPHDFGSGKLWKYFGMGAALTLGGAALRSSWGQKIMGSFTASQAQLAQSQKDLEQAKADLVSDAKRVSAKAEDVQVSALNVAAQRDRPK